MKHFFLISMLCIELCGFSQELKVGIMRAYHLSAVRISHHEGNYTIASDSTDVTTLIKGQSVYLRRRGKGIRIEKAGKSLGVYDTLFINKSDHNNSFSIQSVTPSSTKIKYYQGDLMITPSGEQEINVINLVSMENYLAGVIESEGGGGKHIEYYKVQAILSRTYVLDHLYKHRKDGFSVCDQQHCQAYHSMLRFTPTIRKAVMETKGIIMLDENLNLASGFFFANCGGQTSESDFVWNNPVSYCQSIVDTFCVKSRQAKWTKKIKKSSWRAYLENHFGYPIQDSVYGDLIYTFQQKNRKAFYLSPHLGIPLRDLRMEFRLKSTWFDVRPEGDDVILEGRGFGHGVGLCQEGAMNMAKSGYTFEQILKFYFSRVKLFDYYHWLFLRQKEETGL
ncbi:MAG: SpoIID/LytB domain-containing protein [Crocinitomicaceae bacterium]